jgi:uncharacterized protein (TIGR02217 family)
MPFFEIEFPVTISYLAVGGPAFSTNINKGFSGFEQRNRNWKNSLGKWNVSLITPPLFDGDRQGFIDLLEAFFLNVAGMSDGFRLKDHKDFRFKDQVIGVGDGVTASFQLIKSYAIGNRAYVRNIQKPIWHTITDYQGNPLADTVTAKLNGTPNAAWTLDATTGLITLTSAPAPGVIITASGQFHYPVRFDTDDLAIRLEESDVADEKPIASWQSIPLVEIRPGASSGIIVVGGGSSSLTVIFKSVSYALSPTDGAVLFTTGSSALTATLPSAVGLSGKVFFIKKIDAGSGAVTVVTTAGQTIDGHATYILSDQWQFVELTSDGSNWQISDSN